MTKTILTIVGIVIIVVAGVLFFTNNNSSTPTDELTGSWHTESEREGIKFSVDYTFKGGQYSSLVKQNNGVEDREDKGFYRIMSRHLDGSLVVEKTSETNPNTYEVAIVIIEDGNAMLLEGMRMEKVK